MDWLEGSLWQSHVEDVESALRRFVPGEFVDASHGALGYGHQRVGPEGARVLWDERRAEVHVILPGAWCSALDGDRQREVVSWARQKFGTCSRLDLAGDDHRAARVMPADVAAAVKRGEMVTHARGARFEEALLGTGSTVYVGKRGSRRMLRVYDKDAESHGQIVATRWEVENRDEVALALLQFLDEGADWGECFASMLLGFVDFRARWQRENVSECDRMPWFEELLGAVARWCAYPSVRSASLERRYEWLVRQAAPSLACIASATGDLFAVLELVNLGKARLTREHERLIREYREEVAA